MDSADPRKRRKSPAPDKEPAAAPEAKEPPRRRKPAKDVLTADEALREADELEAAPPPRPAPRTRETLADFFFRTDESFGELLDLAPETEHAAAAEESPREFLSFRLAGEDYAVEIGLIREIVKVPSITEVPRAPRDVMGVMSLRGEVLPVFDVHRRLGLPRDPNAQTRNARVVIVDVGDGPVGVLVDGVEQVVRIRPSAIEATPPGLGSGIEAEYLAGIGHLKERLYILLNLRAALKHAWQGRHEGASR